MSQAGDCIALTGATGFLGSHIADDLLARGYRVRAAVRPSSNLRWLEGKALEIRQVDLVDPGSVKPFLEDTQGLIHCAGVVSAPSDAAYLAGNVDTTITLLESARDTWPAAADQAVVLISSLAAHGPAAPETPALETNPCAPVTAYGRSKVAAEKVVTEGDWPFRTAILRPPGLYGPRDADFLPLFKAAKAGFSARIGTHLKALSLVDGRDAARAAVDLLLTSTAHGIFFVDDGHLGYDFHEMNTALARAAGRRVRLLTVPLGLMKLAAAVVGRHRASRSPVLNPDRLADLSGAGWVCDGSKLVGTTGFQAHFDLERGFSETLAFYKEQRWL